MKNNRLYLAAIAAALISAVLTGCGGSAKADSPEEKNKISHRGRALEQIKEELKKL